MVELVETTDAHFAWFLGEGPAPSPGLRLPPGGLEAAETLHWLRASAARLRASWDGGNWMIVVGGEVVGLCRYREAPNAEGVVEIGYGVAKSRRRQGYATQAVAAMLDYAQKDPMVRYVIAGTSPTNLASQRALQKNGFVPAGNYTDPKEGVSLRWRCDLKKGRKLVLVAACALIDSEGRVLIAERPPGKSMAGLWEFPGGKIEPGESPEDAVIREMREELGVAIEAVSLEPFAFASHAYPEFHLLMPLFLCRKWKGTVTPHEGQSIAWVHPSKLSDYPMPPADLPLLPAFQKLCGG